MDNGIKTFRVWAQETVVRDVFYIVQATSADEATNLVKEGVFDDSHAIDEYVDGEPRFYYAGEVY